MIRDLRDAVTDYDGVKQANQLIADISIALSCLLTVELCTYSISNILT